MGLTYDVASENYLCCVAYHYGKCNPALCKEKQLDGFLGEKGDG